MEGVGPFERIGRQDDPHVEGAGDGNRGVGPSQPDRVRETVAVQNHEAFGSLAGDVEADLLPDVGLHADGEGLWQVDVPSADVLGGYLVTAGRLGRGELEPGADGGLDVHGCTG